MSTDRPSRRDDRGFTLVEIIVVVVILGVLASVATLAVSGTTDRGATEACRAEARAVTWAIESHATLRGSFPAALPDLVPDFAANAPGADTATGGGTYDPSTGAFDPARC